MFNINVFSNGMVKGCLLAFNLNSLHYIELINERAHLSLTKSSGEEVANTTKQMKKQMINIVQISSQGKNRTVFYYFIRTKA